MHPVLALWAHPRSLSTVFERVMIERGDLEVLHEPFSYLYYGREGRRRLDDMAPDASHPRTYPEIRDACLEAAQTRPVFFKDMPYHCLPQLLEDTAFLHAVTHTFLIRDPARSIPSHFALDPAMTLEEVGCEAQHRLFGRVAATTGSAPIVVDAASLQHSGPATIEAYCRAVGLPFLADALRWEKGSPPQWAVWEKWHGDAASSEGIRKTARTYATTVENDERLRAFYDHHRPFYEDLFGRRIRPAATSPGREGP